jgi:hypothetical protein
MTCEPTLLPAGRDQSVVVDVRAIITNACFICSFSNLLSTRDALNCTDTARLTGCPARVVSPSCPILPLPYLTVVGFCAVLDRTRCGQFRDGASVGRRSYRRDGGVGLLLDHLSMPSESAVGPSFDPAPDGGTEPPLLLVTAGLPLTARPLRQIEYRVPHAGSLRRAVIPGSRTARRGDGHPRARARHRCRASFAVPEGACLAGFAATSRRSSPRH